MKEFNSQVNEISLMLKAELARAQALLNRKKPRPDQAIQLLQPYIKKKQVPWPVFHYLGIAFIQKREYRTALELLHRSVEEGASEPETWHSISICHFHLSDFDKAEELEKRALDLDPDFYKGWLHLGSIYRAQARLDEALKCFYKANQLNKKSEGVAFQIGEIFQAQGNMAKALEMYQITLKMDRSHSRAWIAKAEVLQAMGRFEEAEESLYTVLEENPRHVPARVTLGELYKYQGNYDKAITLYERLLDEHPGVGGIRSNYALCLQDLGRFDESEANYLKAFKDQPEIFQSLSNYLMGLHYNPERSKEEIFEAHKLWDEHFAPEERPERPMPFNQEVDKKLRVGLISGGFRQHPVGWMITKALENLPKDQFEIYCYSTNSKHDRVTRRIFEASDKWQSVIGYNDEVLAGMIRDDEVDILVELSGHSADTRLKTVVLEPAPVIVKWVGGLFNTTGLESIDYLLTDFYETPAGEESSYTEKLVRMPDDYICYLPPEYAPEVAPLPAKENGYITFGCFNNPTKVNDAILERWAEIMSRVPDSRLFLKSKQYGTEALRERIVKTMEANGISRDRLQFEGQSPHSELLDSYNRIDIALDPWPYSGGLTTCEALWMGVPVISRPGPTFAGRHSATHLANAGYPEWVTDSWDEYIDKAVDLAENLDTLAELRLKMRGQVAESPVCDGERFGAHLAVALREMWKQRVKSYEEGSAEGEWAEHIEVKPLTDEEVQAVVTPALKSPDGEDISNESESEIDPNQTIFDSSFLDDDDSEPVGNRAEHRIDGHPNKKVNGASHQRSSEKSIHTNGAAKPAAYSDNGSRADQSEAFKIDTKDGVTICTPSDLKLLTPYVLLEQEQWFEPELQFVRDWLKPGMTALDVGAGFGVYALPMAKQTGSEGRVIAFEPGSLAHRHLELSRGENHLVNLEVIKKAASDHTGRAKLHIADTPELNKIDENGTEEISLTSLDAWWEFEGRPEVDLIKVDVNGFEADVLSGATTLLSEKDPVILVSISEGSQSLQGLTEFLEKKQYQLFEYVPGPALLTPFDDGGGHDPYLMNLIAIKDGQTKALKAEGLIHNDAFEPEEPEHGLWKRVLGEQPWTKGLMPSWEKQALSPQNRSYLQALDYLCAAEQVELDASPTSRSEKAVLLLGAAQILIQLYNSGNPSTSVAFTLIRTLRALGKRGQAVEVLQKLIETTQFGKENVNVDLPFMLPLQGQDSAAIKTEFDKWFMVRVVEAWVLLKDTTTYLSGEQERKLLEGLEGNPEVISPVEEKIRHVRGVGEKLARQRLRVKKTETTPQKDKALRLKEVFQAGERIFKPTFWSGTFTSDKAKKVVELTKKFPSLTPDVLKQIVKETGERRDQFDDDNVAFFIQVHALLAMDGNGVEIPELDLPLTEKGWHYKKALYSYWFDYVDFRKSIDRPEVTAIIISNKFKKKSVENLQRLQEQLKDRGEVIFVSNGVSEEELTPLMEYVDIFVKLKGNSGAYLARNMGALFAKGNLLLFVDDDGIPDDGFVDAHKAIHKDEKVIVARGICYSGTGIDPVHYNLGNKVKSAPTLLEGNTSYRSEVFFDANGWGDYLLFGHGGMDMSLKLIRKNFDKSMQVYIPDARLKHAYSKAKAQSKEKEIKQTKSYHLISNIHKRMHQILREWPGELKNDNTNNQDKQFTTPSQVVSIRADKASQYGVNQEILIPENEVHRIDNIFLKHEYALPRGLRLRSNPVVIDIGANVGIFSLYASRWAENVHIFGFEPNPQVYPLLEVNTVSLLGMRRYNFALGREEGELELFQHPHNTGQTSTTYRIKGAKRVNVRMRKASNVIGELGIDIIDVLKIDTEGAEVEILKSLKGCLDKIRIIMAEYHTEEDRKQIERIMSNFLLYSAEVEGLRGVGTVKYINKDYLSELAS